MKQMLLTYVQLFIYKVLKNTLDWSEVFKQLNKQFQCNLKQFIFCNFDIMGLIEDYLNLKKEYDHQQDIQAKHGLNLDCLQITYNFKENFF